MPDRIQRQRVKGWKLPENTICVTRPGRWGNQFRVGDTVQRFSKENICETFTIKTSEQAVAAYREWLDGHLANPPAAKIILEGLTELRGKNLACFCPIGSPCHADVLLELANSSVPLGDDRGSNRD
jgi:hypothetical protein